MNKVNMKKAIVENIILWIILFISFVGIFFLVLDYGSILKVKEHNDTLTNQATRLKSIGKTNDEIISSLNKVNTKYQTITIENLNCVDLGTTEHQIVFKSSVLFSNQLITDGKPIESFSTSFNEANDKDITCTLTFYMK